MADDAITQVNGDLDPDEALRLAIIISIRQDAPPVNDRPALAVEKAFKIHDSNDAHRTSHGQNMKSFVQTSGETNGADTIFGATLKSPCSFGRPNRTMSSSSLGVLDRKNMEEERLARLRKRKASELEQDAAPDSSTRLKLSAKGTKQHLPASEPQVVAEPLIARNFFPEGTGSRIQGLWFPQGVVKKTWARGQPRQGDDVTIDEVLEKDKLELAVLSSFQWDELWLMEKMDLIRTKAKAVLVAFARDERQKLEMHKNIPAAVQGRIRFCFPATGPFGNMHSKLQLLKFGSFLRVVVPTGNLVPYDWGETGAMENMVFLIDLPKLDDTGHARTRSFSAFGKDLCDFLTAQGLDEALVQSLGKYDWSETRRYAFVHTIAGSHAEENAWKKTGYCGLGRAVQSLNLATDFAPVEIDYVCSSFGNVKPELIWALYHACQGDSGLKELETRRSGSRNQDGRSVDEDYKTLVDRFRIYFPSLDTIHRSRGGPQAGGTICLQEAWWESPRFPRRLVRDCVSVRAGLLMHSKLVFVRRRGTPGYAYVGSANLSESAWGRLVKSKGGLKLTCRNWECGVVVPCQSQPQAKHGSPPSAIGKSDSCSYDGSLKQTFEPTIPVPMVLPARSLKTTASTTSPWFSMKSFAM